MDIEIIKSPSKGTIEMLKRRSYRNDFLKDCRYDTIGIIQGKLSEMLVASDIAEKAADVLVEEIKGICPQHFTLIAVFGDTASVTAALSAVSRELKGKVK
jgi:ethanolamine utilization microcompartment shell protein EutS